MTRSLTECKQYSEAAEWFKPRTERAWLKMRDGDITATAAAALFGVCPYMTPFDLFHRLAGTVRVEFEENERMTWGKRLQGAIAKGICADNGWKIVASHAFLYARSKRLPGVACSPDYIIEDPAHPELGYGCLEIKNVDLFVGLDDWSDGEAPPHIEFQLQQQIGVCGFKWGVIGGLIGGNRPHVFRREADAEVIDAIFDAADAMQKRVTANEPPPPDYLKDYQTLRTLYRTAEPGKSIDLDRLDESEGVDAEGLQALIEAKYEADIAAKLADEDKTRAAAALLDALKDTETVFGAGWKVSATTTHRSASVVNYPATTYRNLRVSKPKASKGK